MELWSFGFWRPNKIKRKSEYYEGMGWLTDLAARFNRLFSQNRVPTEGKCGAIALRFIYRRLGRRVSLDQIWNSVKSPRASPGPDSYGSSGHLMCQDALNRGLHAIQVLARYEHGLKMVSKARPRRVEV